MQMIKIKTYNSIMEAELAKNLLKECGIESMVEKRGIEFPGDMGDAYGAELYVSEKNSKKAMEILGVEFSDRNEQ